jgi:1-acyl-sn-glycerol-3-phosphate acyltransferase
MDPSSRTEDHASEAGCSREPLVQTITAFLAHQLAHGDPEIRAVLERTIDEAGPDAIEGLGRRLKDAGRDWSYNPVDPLARRIHHALAPHVLQHRPEISGVEHLDTVAGQPVVMFANHLSYVDANVVDVLLQTAGRGHVSERLTVMAGPKVYSNVRRRFSSLCFGTIKTPQTTELSTEDAVMPARDVARAARRVIEVARERLELGEALLVFAEGSRSRSGRMQRLLSGASRYVPASNGWVLPIGLAGTERLFPIGIDALQSVPLTLRVGKPVRAGDLHDRSGGDRRLMMDCIGYAIAALLPEEYRGVYGGETGDDEPARAMAAAIFEESTN